MVITAGVIVVPLAGTAWIGHEIYKTVIETIDSQETELVSQLDYCADGAVNIGKNIKDCLANYYTLEGNVRMSAVNNGMHTNAIIIKRKR